MSRPTIFAEQYAGSPVADAIREHRVDRDTLLASLVASLKSDPRIRAAYLWGSFGRGDADDLSDLDPWLIVADDFVSQMGKSLRLYAGQTGSFITGGESPDNAPPGGGFFSSLHEGRHGLIHVDCYWQPQSAAEETSDRLLLFRRLHKLATSTPPSPIGDESPTLSPEEDRIETGISFAWLMLSISAKTLARHPDSDMALMIYPRPGMEEAATLLGLENYLKPSDWAVPETPLGKVAFLRHLAAKTAHLTDTANHRALPVSPRNAACLSHYLDMIEGILRCSPSEG